MLTYLLALATAFLPNLTVTPGLTRPLSLKTVCETRWGVDRRHVTLSMKKSVFSSYSIPWSEHAKYEVDHLVPRSLAGADDVLNLWPEIWPEAHKKDQLEVKLGKLVCSGQLSLEAAQEIIRTDWVAAYEKYEGKKPF